MKIIHIIKTMAPDYKERLNTACLKMKQLLIGFFVVSSLLLGYQVWHLLDKQVIMEQTLRDMQDERIALTLRNISNEAYIDKKTKEYESLKDEIVIYRQMGTSSIDYERLAEMMRNSCPPTQTKKRSR